MQVFAETPRLLLREMLPEDAHGLFAVDNDPEVHRYLGNKPVQTLAEIEKVIQFIRQQYLDYGIGRWAVIEKSTGAFMGWSGLKFVTDTQNGHTNYYDLGYRLARKYWGQGFASESAKAGLEYGLNTLGLKELFAVTHQENKGSNNVLTKLNFQRTGAFEDENLPLYWWEMKRH